MIKTVNFLKDKASIISKIKNLDILDAGIDEDNDPYVTLKSGIRFHGIRPRAKDKKFYSLLLSSDIKKILPFECFLVAQDIIIRYVEGGLMYNGPKKNHIYSVKEGDTVAEMGAFMGYYSMKMSQVVGDSGTIIAIEPLPESVRILKKNMNYNNFNNVKIVPKGVWSEKSTITFTKKENDNQSSSIVLTRDEEISYEVDVDSLDNILNELSIASCNQMIIQLNGVEIEGLEGLSIFKPKHLAIAARYDREGVDTIQYISDLLKRRGYQVTVSEDKFVFGKLK